MFGDGGLGKTRSYDFCKIPRTIQNATCNDHLFQLKWSNRFACPACKHNVYAKITTRTLPLFQCKKCKHQTTVMLSGLVEIGDFYIGTPT
ncbi:transposase [Paenibacillus sp. BJ-4]|uniref:transposase n=1 Tax=Paenibacillus sp. BJ-4 TaxID=2878097 RepID=UPI001CF0AEDE